MVADRTALEQQLSELFQRGHCLLTGSGTSALYGSYIALGLEPGDRILYPDNTCETAVNAAIYAGLSPDFCDSSPDSPNIEAAKAAEKLQTPEYAAFVPTHMFGVPAAPVDRGVSRTAVVEDAAQGFGAALTGEGQLSIMSFGEGKVVDCGGGGAILADDPQLLERARLALEECTVSVEQREKLRSSLMMALFTLSKQGLDAPDFRRARDELKAANKSAWVFGTDADATEAIAKGLESLPERLDQRARIGEALMSGLAGIPGLHLPDCPSGTLFWRLPVLVDVNRDEVFNQLVNRGVAASRYFKPMHREFGLDDADFPNAVDYHNRVINLQLELDEDQAISLVATIKEVMKVNG